MCLVQWCRRHRRDRAVVTPETGEHRTTGTHCVNHAEVVEHLLGARLQPVGPRPDEQLRRTVDQPAIHAPGRQVAGEHETGRPSTDNQYVKHAQVLLVSSTNQTLGVSAIGEQRGDLRHTGGQGGETLAHLPALLG